MSTPIIKIENLSKMYRLGVVGTGTLSHDLKRWYYRVRGKEDPYLKIGETNISNKKSASEYVWALKDINLEVMPGEVLGIIGKNGAGKSTLLKILSKVTGPTTGSIHYNGRIGSLLEVGTGFHSELTGRENIFLNGAILGMTKAEIRSKLDEIIDFSGVERYIDTPVKRYSSGMMVRLGFAVAAHLEPEILVVDEVLAVGDADFQKKAIGKMQDVSKNDGRTVLFVSHNMASLQQLCLKGILLENGIITINSSIDDTINKYLSTKTSQSYYINKLTTNIKKDVYIKEIRILGNDKNDKNIFNIDDPILIYFKLQILRNKEKYNIFCMILDQLLNRVFAAESESVESEMYLKINPYFLVRGMYSLHVFINIPRNKQEDVAENVCHFEVIDKKSILTKHGDYDYGSVFGNYVWLK